MTAQGLPKSLKISLGTFAYFRAHTWETVPQKATRQPC